MDSKSIEYIVGMQAQIDVLERGYLDLFLLLKTGNDWIPENGLLPDVFREIVKMIKEMSLNLSEKQKEQIGIK